MCAPIGLLPNGAFDVHLEEGRGILLCWEVEEGLGKTCDSALNYEFRTFSFILSNEDRSCSSLRFYGLLKLKSNDLSNVS